MRVVIKSREVVHASLSIVPKTRLLCGMGGDLGFPGEVLQVPEVAGIVDVQAPADLDDRLRYRIVPR